MIDKMVILCYSTVLICNKPMIKKLSILSLIFTFLISAQPASALVFSSYSTSDLIENTFNAETVDFSVDVDFKTKNENMSQPAQIHADIDGQYDSIENNSFDLFVWLNDQGNYYQEFRGSMIMTPDSIFITESDNDWYFTDNDFASLISTNQNSSQNINEFESVINEMIDSGIVKYSLESADFINGKLTARYKYEIDFDNFQEQIIEEGALSQDELEEMSEVLGSLSAEGNLWIDTSEMLPVMFTLNITSTPSENSYTAFDISVLFNSFNQPVNPELPANAISIEDYNSNEVEDFVMSSFEDIADNMDIDGDGLTNEDELSIWFTDPLSSDSDNDGYKDNIEVINGYNPNGTGKLDSDKDGLSDYTEMTIHWTDRFDADSDNDGYNDGLEIANGYDPNGPGRW